MTPPPNPSDPVYPHPLILRLSPQSIRQSPRRRNPTNLWMVIAATSWRRQNSLACMPRTLFWMRTAEAMQPLYLCRIDRLRYHRWSSSTWQGRGREERREGYKWASPRLPVSNPKTSRSSSSRDSSGKHHHQLHKNSRQVRHEESSKGAVNERADAGHATKHPWTKSKRRPRVACQLRTRGSRNQTTDSCSTPRSRACDAASKVNTSRCG